MQCKAKSKRSGKQCRRRAMKNQQVCMMHGGKSRKGLSHPNIKTGEHADPRYLGILREHNTDAAARFSELASDKTRHSLEPEITTLDLRAEEIYRQIMSGEYRSCSDLLRLAEAVVEAQIAKDREKSLQAWQTLMQALRDGKTQERGWEKFDQLAWRRKPKLVEMEAKRRVLQQEMYERRSVVELLQAVAALVKRTVKDKDEADAIYRGIVSLTGGERAGRLSGNSAPTGRGH